MSRLVSLKGRKLTTRDKVCGHCKQNFVTSSITRVATVVAKELLLVRMCFRFMNDPSEKGRSAPFVRDARWHGAPRQWELLCSGGVPVTSRHFWVTQTRPRVGRHARTPALLTGRAAS